MDGDRFDDATRALAAADSRRRMVKRFGLRALGGALAVAGLGAAEAEAGCEPPAGDAFPSISVKKNACECVRFTWDPVPGATRYVITIDGVEEFNGPGNLKNGQLVKKLCGFPRKNGDTYTACFQASNDCGLSEPAVCGEFNTIDC
jgi:hypothetical protein